MTSRARGRSAASNPATPFDSKGVLNNERRRLARLATRRREQDAVQARLDLRRAEAIASTSPDIRATVATSLAGTLRAVAATWGLDLYVAVAFGGDSTKVLSTGVRLHIQLPATAITTADGALRLEAVRGLAADVKGLGYHEIGHLLHTVPFHELVHHAGRSGHGTDIAALSSAWALLEDQRMEARMVADSPVLGHYFAATVIRHLTRHRVGGSVAEPPPVEWLLVAGRDHVPATVRDPLRASFAAARGEVHAATVERLIGRYRSATTLTELWDTLVDFTHFVDDDLDMPMPGSGLGDEARALAELDDSTPARGQKKSAAAEQIARSLAASATPAPSPPSQSPPAQSPPAASPSASAPTRRPTDPATTTSATPSERPPDVAPSPAPALSTSPAPAPASAPGTGGGGQHGNAGAETPSTSGRMLEALRHAERSRLDDRALDHDLAEIVSAIDALTASLPRRHEPLGRHGALVHEAESAARLMVEALTTYTSDSAPIWQTRQERGVLDPFAFRTRRPGTRDHFRACVGNGDRANDLAVSLVLDVSGSMVSHGASLGAAAYACKHACDQLAIPCTVTVFASRGQLLWDIDDEPVPLVLETDGTTDPTMVCEALDSQRHGRALQLVLMLTDGVFDSSFGGLARYWTPDRAIVLVGLGDSVARAHADTTGVHELLCISSVLDLPRTVTNVLASLV